ncbi:jg18400 [Pararge aegeria aegeria]|uniref:Jg18400 protein n=1 Tax=Pararge aegeria aegeria TaxID=348720 RepID=A0A8S4RBY7_9NEOP|nr:jg18400 [Pararge aegeria aegeria]
MREIEHALGSNLCRCTGYRPILEAFKTFASDAPKPTDILDIEDLKICKKSGELCTGLKCEHSDWCIVPKKEVLYIKLSDDRDWYRVNTLIDVFNLWQEKGTGSYMLVNGNTGKGVYPILEYPKLLIDISSVLELQGYYIDQNLVLGGGTTLVEVLHIFKKLSKNEGFRYLDVLHDHIEKVAHVTVRNLATVAGNLFLKNQHSDFKSDIFLLFETVGAEVTIMTGPEQKKVLTMQEFLLENMAGKIILNVLLPPLSKENKIATFKIQCAGEAKYVDDTPSLPGEVFLAFVLAKIPLGTIRKIDPSIALSEPGVIAFYSAADIPGVNSFIPAPNKFNLRDEELFCNGEVKYYDQPVGVIVAECESIAKKAATLVHIEYANVRKPVLDIKINKNDPNKYSEFVRYQATEVGSDTTRIIIADDTIYSQYAFTMETLTCVAYPTEEGIKMISATQWMDLVQQATSRVLQLDENSDNGYVYNEPLMQFGIDVYYNCYRKERWDHTGYNATTDTASNSWVRAPGTIEGVAMAELVMERISYELNLDALEVRMENLDRVAHSDLIELTDTLKKNSQYDERKNAVDEYNKNNRWKKRGLRFSWLRWPTSGFQNFEINMSVYVDDGTVSITHGGIEMGQGINTKAIQIAAYFLGLPVDKVQVKPNDTMIAPNCIASGASVTSQNVGIGVRRCCEQLLQRLAPIRNQMNNPVWRDLIKEAYRQQVDLQAHYYTNINDSQQYDVYGVTLAEVEIDVLTGEHTILRVDLIEDAGRSVNPEVDLGQIEGAFIFGVGYWTSEHLVYHPETGELLTNRTWEYWIPQALDIPEDFRVYFRRRSFSNEAILGAKATGEPATCMGIAIAFALREAISLARLDSGIPSTQWFQIDCKKYRVDGRKSRRKLNSKHQAQIDVASFIQIPGKSSIDENQPYEQFEQKFGDGGAIDFGTYVSFPNANDGKEKDKREYRNLNADKIPEVNIIQSKHFIPQNMNLNTLSGNELDPKIIEPHGIGDIKKFGSPYNSNVAHISRTEKKCALKNMKIPFFSRKKHNTTKPKKGKKRRPFGFRKGNKQSTAVSKISIRNMNLKVARTTESIPNMNKIIKRSYFESLCPACRQKFFQNSNLDAFDNGLQASNNIIHNSRQYFRKVQNPKLLGKDKKYNLELKPNSLESNVGFDISSKNLRWRRDEANEEKRKKILDDIENKIRSLKMFYQQSGN